ncbi:hypothetical protein RchiOBHm_Chr6g0265621 [Rosa chinensis]|uniref:Uncharacterized protein n=1 Tax=Rosa chinensis TaxID=74649 RepID=A0A2P6PPH9_ROSCH|nr:hypothetical protein RchiOBHm_Chr6g0265621 [Rosa chinensis]
MCYLPVSDSIFIPIPALCIKIYTIPFQIQSEFKAFSLNHVLLPTQHFQVLHLFLIRFLSFSVWLCFLCSLVFLSQFKSTFIRYHID